MLNKYQIYIKTPNLYIELYTLLSLISEKQNIIYINPSNMINLKNSDTLTRSAELQPVVRRRRRRNKTQIMAPSNDRTELLFPKNREMFELVNDKYHLRDLINEENRKHGLSIQTHTYCFERGPRSYMYTKCISCGHKQKLKYMKQNNSA